MTVVNCNEWQIIEPELNFRQIEHYETIFTLGNGYLGNRGNLEESYQENNPGTFVAGTFDKAPGEVTELANTADWTAVEIMLADERFDLKRGTILEYNRTLDLKKGLLTRKVKWKSPKGKITELYFERFVSIVDQHIMGNRIKIRPVNYSGIISYKSILNGQVTHSGTQHFIEKEKCAVKDKGIYLVQTTQESEIKFAQSAFHQIKKGNHIVDTEDYYNTERRLIFYKAEFKAERGQEYTCDKLVSIYNTRDTENPQKKAIEKANMAIDKGYKRLVTENIQAWEKEWQISDIKIDGPDFDQLAIRFAIFHLLQMTHKTDDCVSVGAKALSGEGYRGHVFWDTEIFILPFFIYNFPEAARTLLMYRYKTLDGARKKAKDNGYRGAQFAWESARTGEETTPKWDELDIETGEPIRIWTGELEQHITADVVYGIWHYYKATKDMDFLKNYGAEIIIETSRFWSDRVEYNNEKDRYEINDIIGPDEYSTHVDNNVFTNMMVQWQLRKAVEIANNLKKNHPQSWNKVCEKINLEENELKEWSEIADKIFINYDSDNNLYIQYEGFLEADNIDDKIAEAKKAGNFLPYHLSWEKIIKSQALKQADVVMLQYLLSDKFTIEEKRTAWELYEPKTMHDSSLSPSIHAIVAVEMGEIKKAYDYFKTASNIDLTLGGSEDGLHAASLGGLWQTVINGFAGIRLEENQIVFKPSLPETWNSMSFSFEWRDYLLNIYLTPENIKINTSSEKEGKVSVKINNQNYLLKTNDNCNFNYKTIKK